MIAYVPQPAPDPRQPQGRGVILRPEEVRATIAYLRLCQQARALGWSTRGPVRAEYEITRDPEWLVDMAINRRAGWPEDPHSRECCMPVGGKLPKRAEGDNYRTLVQFAHRVNGRCWIRPRELRILGRVGRAKLAARAHDDEY